MSLTPEPITIPPAPNTIVCISVSAVGLILTGLSCWCLGQVYKRHSQLSDNKIRQSVWSRIDDIIRQPTQRPLLLTVLLVAGAPTFSSVVSAALIILWLPLQLMSILILLISLGFMWATAAYYYRVYRGLAGSSPGVKGRKTVIGTVFLFQCTLLFVQLINLGLPGALARIAPQGSTSTYILITLFMSVLGNLPTALIAVFCGGKEPATSRLIYNPEVITPWLQLDRTILAVCVPCVFVRVAESIVLGYVPYIDYYPARLAVGSLVLMQCAFVALIAVYTANRSILGGDYQWQWRGYLTIAVPLLAVHIVAAPFSILFQGIAWQKVVEEALRSSLGYGATAVAFIYVYLRCIRRHVHANRLADGQEFVVDEDTIFAGDEDLDAEELVV